MFTTIKGVYDNGQISFIEPPPAIEKANVLVTFETEEKINNNGTPQKLSRHAGFGKGTFTYIADDFDEPLDELKEYME